MDNIYRNTNATTAHESWYQSNMYHCDVWAKADNIEMEHITYILFNITHSNKIVYANKPNAKYVKKLQKPKTVKKTLPDWF